MNKQRLAEDQKLLDQYLRLKPSRAIDRLLSEYNLDKSYQIYNLLQEKIKKNTTELRATLTEKYQNLVDCSNLLGTIKIFTDEISSIEKNISKIYYENHSSQIENEKNHKKSLINKIEEKILRKRYSQAMKMTYYSYDKINQSELMYLPFLRIQIIQSLEEEIIDKKFTKQFIMQIILCLKYFLENLKPEQQVQIVNNERQQGSLLTLIADAINLRQKDSSITQSNIIEIVFKCKLLSLHRGNTKRMKQQEYISKFFHDIYKLISEKQNQSEEINHLSSIFCKNLSKIEAHLLQTFIVKGSDKIINFRQLYQKLVNSQEFINTLQLLYQIIIKNYQQAPKTSLKQSFINLWQNYYVQLIQLLFNKCNPLEFLPKLKTSKSIFPRQIQKYICSDTITIQNRVKLYRQEVNYFLVNISELFKKTNQLKSSRLNLTDILQKMTRLYISKVNDLNQKILDYAQEISNQPTLHKLSETILLFMYCSEFNQSTNKQKERQSSYLKEIRKCQLTWSYEVINKYCMGFYDKTMQLSKWSINFDHYFMKYYNPIFNSAQISIIKQIILILLEKSMEIVDKDKADAFLQGKRKQKARSEKQLLDKIGKLPDITPQKINIATFAKKKPQRQHAQSVQQN